MATLASRSHTLQRSLRFVFTASLACAIAATGGCTEEELQAALGGDAATSGTILSAISRAATASGAGATPTPGSQPSGADAGLTLTLVPNAPAVTNGGTATVNVSAANAFSEVYVGIAGLEGFYAIALPAAVTSADIQITVDQDYRSATIAFDLSVSDGVNTGPIATQPYQVVIVGSGDVQVSLTFDQQDDVDLAVQEPSMEVVDYTNTTSMTGGTLDLDANPSCGNPTGNAENITWPEGSAPSGTYSVFVNLFQSCTLGPVNWTLTVHVVGSPPQIFNGTLQAGDVGNGLVTPVATFMVQ